MIALSIAALLCALIPAVVFCVNLRLYVAPPATSDPVAHSVSILIPARNEAGAITECVTSALASQGVEFEIVVMDDSSTDGTAEIVRAMAGSDARVRLIVAPPLPSGWNGKQHACWELANAAQLDVMCFVDADVRLAPMAIANMARFLTKAEAALVSGFPRQLTETWMEKLLLPLIHFVLLGFLPIGRMRRTTDPSLAAGCGQFMMVEREAYFPSGGHAAIRTTMHDGLLLPRLLRQHGYRTDLADLTGLATCRMYRNGREVWQGLAKNATEGLGSPRRIVPVSLLLAAGQVLPFCLVAALVAMRRMESAAGILAVAAMTAAWLPRWLAVRRFHQSPAGAMAHPVGILLLLAVQWYALVREWMRRPVSWKSRAYGGE